MAVANPCSFGNHLLRTACASLLTVAVAACFGPSNNGDPDCSQGEGCDVSNSDAGNSSPDGGSPWAQVDLQDFQAAYKLLPRGTFVFKSSDSDSAQLVSKNTDDSIVTATIDETPNSSNQGNTSDWKIWHADMYYKVEYTQIGEGASQHWGFITGSLQTPGGTIDSPKTLAIDKPYGGVATASVSEMSPLFMAAFSYASFVNAYNNKDAVFEKTEAVAGVSCKKYVVNNALGFKEEWWILDNGFCLKHQFSSNGTVQSGFETLTAELDTPDYNYVTQKYAQFANQTGAVPRVEDMLKIAEGVSADVWTAPSDFVPWTAGGIRLIVLFRAVNWNGNPVFEVFFSFPDGNTQVAATEDYKSRILQIPGMALTSTAGTADLGYIWEYSNSDSVTCGPTNGYWEYRVSTIGTTGPSSPAQITAVFTRLICV